MAKKKDRTPAELLKAMIDEKAGMFDQKLANYWVEYLVREKGQPYSEIGPLPPKTKTGTAKQCFDNAQKLAVKLKWTYVEGIALADLGSLKSDCHHAWVVSPAGKVVDPTWPAGTGKAYFGIPFKPAEVKSAKGEPMLSYEYFRAQTGREGVIPSYADDQE